MLRLVAFRFYGKQPETETLALLGLPVLFPAFMDLYSDAMNFDLKSCRRHFYAGFAPIRGQA